MVRCSATLARCAIGSLSSKIDGGISHVCLKGSADFEGQRLSRTVCGWSDAQVKWSVNFFGAPALSLDRFASYRQNLVLGASLQVGVPSGEYDSARLINIGANRWSAKPEIGLSKVLGRRWSVDLALAGTFYEANDEYYGGRTRAQDPIYSFQAHAVRMFPKGVWIAVDGTRYRGGQTRTGGLEDQNLQSNGRLGLTVALPINRRQSIKMLLQHRRLDADRAPTLIRPGPRGSIAGAGDSKKARQCRRTRRRDSRPTNDN